MSLRRFDDTSPTRATAADDWAIRRILAGWSADAVATATGMSKRTAQRWIADLVCLETVTMGGWTATYVLRRSKPPVRITPWERVA